jgi:ATP-dependent DNA ligase
MPLLIRAAVSARELSALQRISEHELEGVVAKRLHQPYLCGERMWAKVEAFVADLLR